MPRGRRSSATPSRARSNSVTSNASAVSRTSRTSRSAAAAASSGSATRPRASQRSAPGTPKAAAAALPATTAVRNDVEDEVNDDAGEDEVIYDAEIDPNRKPPLPVERNPALPNADVPVKLQIIQRESNTLSANNADAVKTEPKDIVIGRVKLPTVNGAVHGFLLKR